MRDRWRRTLSNFSALERAVLDEICHQYPTQRAALEAQLAAAVVRSRENTGAGVYTHFEINRSVAPAIAWDRVIGNVSVKIDGFEDPMIFLLFTDDGYANCLEGAAICDSTIQVNLNTVRFEIVRS
jgi:hypothetical protein